MQSYPRPVTGIDPGALAGVRILNTAHRGAVDLRAALERQGATVVDAPALSLAVSNMHPRWGPPPDPDRLRAGVRAVAGREVDAVVFTSAPAASAFLAAARSMQLLPMVVEAMSPSGPVVAVAVGPMTAAPLHAVGVAALMPQPSRLGVLVRTLAAGIAGRTVSVPTICGPLELRQHSALVNGRTVPLTPTGVAVLRVLIAGRGDVVSRAEILAAMPGATSNAHAAEVAVGRLRESLGSRELIRTVVKRGYRLAVVDPQCVTDFVEPA